eukprot:11216752-Lingulodinium_polyedra.AAC.1
MQRPNVLSILDVFVGGRRLQLCVKCQISCVYSVWKSARGCLERAEARRYVGHVFAGLRHLHAHGVCRRDLRLPNLLLSFRGNIVQIADLGFAACVALFSLGRN